MKANTCAVILSTALLAASFTVPALASSSFDLAKAQSYIESQYNPSLGLVSENERVDKYWLWSDNELAAVSLRDYSPDLSENITSSVLAYDVEFRSAYGMVLGKETTFLAPTNRNITEQIWYTDFAGDSELQCIDYADIAFLKSIYYYNMADYAQSTECYLAGQSMFDGTGFKDKAYLADGERYSTYKVALWKIAADLARSGEEDAESKAAEILARMQDKDTGGVYTHYRADLKPDSQTNIETTSLAVIASDLSLLQRRMEPATSEQLEKCKELGIDWENCSAIALLQHQQLQDLDRERIERDKDQMNTAMRLVGIGAAIAGVMAFFALRKRFP